MRSESDTGRTRVVVVDDDPGLLEMIGDALAAEGYEAWRCRGADGALPLIEAARAEAVVLDLYLDGEARGWNILQHLKADPKTRDLPVLLCSSAVRSLLEYEPLISASGVRTLGKPFDLADLLQAVRQMTVRARQHTS